MEVVVLGVGSHVDTDILKKWASTPKLFAQSSFSRLAEQAEPMKKLIVNGRLTVFIPLYPKSL